jgi:hypothetical protein
LLLHYWCDSPLVKNASGGEDLSGERSDATHGGGGFTNILFVRFFFFLVFFKEIEFHNTVFNYCQIMKKIIL